MITAANEPAHLVSPSLRPTRGTTADPQHPTVALLSNGSYGVMMTDAGAGRRPCRDLDVTRWREDATRDCWGQFVYVRSPDNGAIWSIARQPIPRALDECQVEFHADRAEFRRRDGDVETC